MAMWGFDGLRPQFDFCRGYEHPQEGKAIQGRKQIAQNLTHQILDEPEH
jgi:hypothetical protein